MFALCVFGLYVFFLDTSFARGAGELCGRLGGLTGYTYWVTSCILTLDGQGPSNDKIKRTFFGVTRLISKLSGNVCS